MEGVAAAAARSSTGCTTVKKVSNEKEAVVALGLLWSLSKSRWVAEGQCGAQAAVMTVSLYSEMALVGLDLVNHHLLLEGALGGFS